MRLSPAEYKKAKLPERDETQMLLAVNSRYEDAHGKRIHIMPTLDDSIILCSRKKVVGLHVPSVDAITLDLLEEYGVNTTTQPLWVRPPFILPSSWAPWSLEAGRQYWLASSQLTTPYPGASSRQAVWDWHLENVRGNRMFIPHDFPGDASKVTVTDWAEINVRLWDDARGPGAARQAEIQSILFAATMRGEGIERYAPILPDDRSILTRPPAPDDADERLVFNGWEEATWAAILDDPDIDLFGLDPEESTDDWETTKNLFLESDNLLALKRLRRGYTGKVKLTYIDPPYNTGNAFIYNDSFKREDNTGSPFTGQRWGRGTWRILRAMPWFNRKALVPRNLVPVDDSMLKAGGRA